MPKSKTSTVDGQVLRPAPRRSEPGVLAAVEASADSSPSRSAETGLRYVGTELGVAKYARKWKSYVASILGPCLTGEVLEVGAGIGAATESLYDGTQQRWVCLEPDRILAEQICTEHLPNPRRCETAVGTLRDLSRTEMFDAVIYMDVLEHIQDDAAEMSLAADHLRPGGVIAVVAPAFPRLYSQFDAAVRHYRRYTKNSLRAVAPLGTREEICRYLDAAGMLMSVGNRYILRSANLTASRVLFWDRLLIPVSRVIDPLLGYNVGRSVLIVWRKTA